MEKLKHHIFVCGSARLVGENKGFCLQKGGVDIIQAFNEEVQDRGLDGDIMVTSTGCLGLCSKGPVVIIYPDQTWYGKVSVDDVEEIMDALEQGETVERLTF
ncbi:MAG: (2Fe-2S) ferredoxin domain-containing protein [Eubacteriaceae bacterium]|nr:(2Fe-2S) ferredoxin domain-containing protein [Eubacteriaceae bacterium]